MFSASLISLDFKRRRVLSLHCRGPFSPQNRLRVPEISCGAIVEFEVSSIDCFCGLPPSTFDMECYPSLLILCSLLLSAALVILGDPLTSIAM